MMVMGRRLVIKVSLQVGLFLCLSLSLAPCKPASAATAKAAPLQGSDGPVILVTLDGVRRVDFYNRKLFSWFWKHLGPRGTALNIQVSNPWRVSLPGYHSMFSGVVQPCFGNRCGRVRTETMFERVRRELGLRPRDVAAITSWAPVGLSVQHKRGAVYVSPGRAPVPGERDRVLRKLTRVQRRGRLPWRFARWDKHTWAYAKRYLVARRPKLLLVSLLDADKWAHKRSMKRYKASLRRYDRWLRDLSRTLARMGDYGRRATIVVATDHGRGYGRSWWRHGLKFPHSRHAWMFVAGPCVAKGEQPRAERHGHIDLRPTIERTLGLAPMSCRGCGAPIPAFTRCPERVAGAPLAPGPARASEVAARPSALRELRDVRRRLSFPLGVLLAAPVP